MWSIHSHSCAASSHFVCDPLLIYQAQQQMCLPIQMPVHFAFSQIVQYSFSIQREIVSLKCFSTGQPIINTQNKGPMEIKSDFVGMCVILLGWLFFSPHKVFCSFPVRMKSVCNSSNSTCNISRSLCISVNVLQAWPPKDTSNRTLSFLV